jgi:large subunit ribosomal protein L24
MRRTSNSIPKLHIKKEDTVMVLSGDDRGKTGRVLEVMPKERMAIVEGVNIKTRHSKVTAQNPEGGRIKISAPVPVSKLMVVEPKSGKPSRVGRKTNAEGKLVRVTKKSGEELK